MLKRSVDSVGEKFSFISLDIFGYLSDCDTCQFLKKVLWKIFWYFIALTVSQIFVRITFFELFEHCTDYTRLRVSFSRLNLRLGLLTHCVRRSARSQGLCIFERSSSMLGKQ